MADRDGFISDFLGWLNVHILGKRKEHPGFDYEQGYIIACEDIRDEFKRLLEEDDAGLD